MPTEQLTPERRAALWTGSPWFRGVLPGEFLDAAAKMQERRFQRGTVLGTNSQGAEATPLRLVVHGLVSLTRRSASGTVVFEQGPGTILGTQSVTAWLGDQPRLRKVGVGNLSEYSVRATTDLWVSELTVQHYSLLPRHQRFEEIHELYDIAPELVAWLRSEGWFWHLQDQDLLALLPEAQIEIVRKDKFLGHARGHVFFVGHGSGAVFDQLDGVRHPPVEPDSYLVSGTGLGVEDVFYAREVPRCFQPFSPCLAVSLFASAFEETGLAPSPPLRADGETLGPAVAPGLPTIGPAPHRVVVPVMDPQLVADPFAGADLVPTLPELVERLARTIADHLGDRVILLRWQDGSASPCGTERSGPLTESTFASLDQLADPSCFEAYDVVVVDVSGLLANESVGGVASLVDTLPLPVAMPYLFDDPQRWEHRVEILGAVSRVRVLPVGVMTESWRDTRLGLGEACRLVADGVKTAFRGIFGKPNPGGTGSPREAPPEQEYDLYPPRKFLPRWPLDTTRVRFPGGSGGPADGAADEWARSLERIAQASTRRRVGLAIGGGGALSFSGMPLIEGMRELGIPVDAVAGTSGGALVGAFFASQGQRGIDRLLAKRFQLSSLMATALFTNRPAGWWVDWNLGGVDLNQLTTPLFAVATDADTAEELIVERGTPGLAVRAAGNIPPFAPAVSASRRLIDGAYADNVPAAALRDHGCDLVIGTNPYPGLIQFRALRGLAGLPPADVAHESFVLPRILDQARANLTLWGFGAAQGASRVDVEFRTTVGAELALPGAWSLSSQVVAMARRSWELRVALSRVHHLWRASLRDPPCRWRLKGRRLEYEGRFCFNNPGFIANLKRTRLDLLELDIELLEELLLFLADHRPEEDPSYRLRVVGTWDLSLAPIPLPLLNPAFIPIEYVRRRFWAEAAADAVVRVWNHRLDVGWLPRAEAAIELGEETSVRFELIPVP